MSAALAIRESGLSHYLAEIAKIPVLAREEETALARRLKEDHDVEAAHRLVVANLRFVAKIAHEYRGYGLKLVDLIQEGNLGLMHAVQKFDPERGYRLITYAVWWIRAQIQSFVLRSWSLVRVSSGRASRKLFFKLRSERSRAEQQAQGKVDVAELAEHLGVRPEEYTEMEMRMAARDFSLDAPVAEEVDTKFVDQLVAETPTPESNVAEREDTQRLAEAVTAAQAHLTDQEKVILESRLLTDDPSTLASLGKQFGVSRQRVQQLEKGLLQKLKDAWPAHPRRNVATASP